jgi:hypothetical protein
MNFRSAGAWNALFACRRAAPRCGVFALRNEPLAVTVFAYLLVVAGLFWVTMPYLLRDQINWSARSNFRWRFMHGIALVYGAVILGFAFTRY